MRQTAVWPADDETPTRHRYCKEKEKAPGRTRNAVGRCSQLEQFQYVQSMCTIFIFWRWANLRAALGATAGIRRRREMGTQMKTIVFAGLLLFVGVGTAQAQADVGSTSASIGSNGSINSGGSISSGSGINSTAHINNAGSVSGTPSYRNIAGQNPDAYVPSTFENYQDAVSQGDEARRMRQPSLADAARNAQQAKAAHPAKPGVVVERDATGKLVATPAAPETPAVPATPKN